MSYSLGDAARATGVNRSTILRAIRAGKISAARDEATGGWSIEPAELHRVYPPAADATDDAPARNGVATGEIALLRALIADKDDVIADLRHRLDQEAEDRRRATEELRQAHAKVTALLTDQSKPRRRWWHFRQQG